MQGLGDQASQGDGEAAPQVRGPPLPDEVGGVVVAVPAQRLPHRGIVLGVPGRAGAGAPVDAAARAAGVWPAAAVAVAVAVHRAEGGGGDGGEDQRVVGHRLGDGLAAGDPRAQQAEHVAGVQPRTRGALAGAAVAAAYVGDAEWLVLAGVGG